MLLSKINHLQLWDSSYRVGHKIKCSNISTLKFSISFAETLRVSLKCLQINDDSNDDSDVNV